MSMKDHVSMKLPKRWLNCPNHAESLVVDKFIAFKVPLSERFQNVPEDNRFHMSMLIESVKQNFNKNVGLIIDLTNTNRFYDALSEVKQLGIEYFKLNCKGHGEPPTRQQVNVLINKINSFIDRNPSKVVGIHCTHGFNRTGFVICSYLVERYDCDINTAIEMFATCRSPGIYKQQYIDILFDIYATDTCKSICVAPALPSWEETNFNKN